MDDSFIKAVFLDLDGTLINTEPLYNRFWREASKEKGYELTYEQALSLRSLDRNKARELFRKWFNEDCYEKIRELRKAKMNAYLESNPIERKSGAKELLEYLQKENIKSYVVTATKKEDALLLLEKVGLKDFIYDIISTKDNIKEGKPSPEVYLKALEISKLSEDEVIAIEDSPNGIISAYEAGLTTIYIPDLTPFDESISEYAFAAFDTLEEVISYIEVSKIV